MYILECIDGTFYTGSTKYIVKRIQQHKSGLGSIYTASRLPLKVVYIEEYENITKAFNRERQVKKWSQRKKIALIKKDYKALISISNKKS